MTSKFLQQITDRLESNQCFLDIESIKKHMSKRFKLIDGQLVFTIFTYCPFTLKEHKAPAEICLLMEMITANLLEAVKIELNPFEQYKDVIERFQNFVIAIQGEIFTHSAKEIGAIKPHTEYSIATKFVLSEFRLTKITLVMGVQGKNKFTSIVFAKTLIVDNQP